MRTGAPQADDDLRKHVRTQGGSMEIALVLSPKLTILDMGEGPALPAHTAGGVR